MDPQIQPQGSPIPQSQPLPGQELNPGLGYSYVVSDMDRLKRFLCLGSELNYYKAGQKHRKFSRSEVQSIDRLIQAGRGNEVVKCIKDISVTGRAVKQNTVLYALAVCARAVDRQTKLNAYSVLSDVCRIPTHLFQFIKYCEEMSSNETGWGRAHRTAISEWYKKFDQESNYVRSPKKLAYLVTKYKSRYGFRHRDVLRLAHVKAKNRGVRIVLQYLLGKDVEAPNSQESQEALDFINAVHEAKACEDENRLCELIASNELSWQHIPNKFLKDNIKVWGALARLMPMTALIRNLGKMSELGMHESHEPKDFWVDLVEERLGDEVALANSRIHPLTLLIAWKQYSKGQSNNGKMQWTVNERISDALKKAFFQYSKIITPSGRRYLMAVSVGENMRKEICRSTIRASEAAAAMVLATVQTENVEVILFTDSIEEANIVKIVPTDTLETIESKITSISPIGKQPVAHDLSVPFKWSAARRDKFDAIIIFTDSVTSCGYMHPAEAVKQYAQYVALPKYRLVVVAMTSDRYTIAGPDDGNTLDVIGFDTHTPALIMDFIDEFRPKETDMDIVLHQDEAREEDMVF